MSQENKELHAEIEAILEEKESLINTNTKLADKNQELIYQIKKRDELIETLQLEKDTLEDENEKLQTKLSKYTERNK